METIKSETLLINFLDNFIKSKKIDYPCRIKIGAFYSEGRTTTQGRIIFNLGESAFIKELFQGYEEIELINLHEIKIIK